MARRKSTDELPLPAPPPPVNTRADVRRWVLQLFVVIFVASLVLAGIALLGSYARQQLRDHDRFQLAFAAIECNCPPALQRAEFLEEVQYLSGLPDKLPLLDADLADRISKGFARHPWVASVDKVEIVRPQTVRMALVFRQAVLAVVVAPDLAGPGLEKGGKPLSLRAVDAQGFLLPKNANPLDLPVLHGAARPAPGAGPWGDASVVLAAQTVSRLDRQMARLQITDVTCTTEGLVLWGPSFKVLWGQPVESGKFDGAPPSVREKHLLEINAPAEEGAPFWPWMHEYDVRPRSGTRHRLVPREAVAG